MKLPTLRNVAAFPLAIVGLMTPGLAVADPDAEDIEISIEFDDLVFGREGSTKNVSLVEVDDDAVGRECDLTVVTENQSSVHPGNDLIVTTGASQLVVIGIEDEPDGRQDQEFEVVLGETIEVELRFGGNEMSSLGFTLDFVCLAERPVVEPDPDPDPNTTETTQPTPETAPVIDETTPTWEVTGPITTPSTVPETTISTETTPDSAGQVPASTTTRPPSTSTTPAPTVLGAQQERTPAASGTVSVPLSPAASPLQQQPTYTG